MKQFLLAFILTTALLPRSGACADLIFGTTVYYLCSDSAAATGSALTSSGSTLSGFNFSTVSPAHPIFHGGVYFPVSDCQNNNLWVRLRHTAADPNGTSNGQNIQSTSNIMFQAGDAVLGGWNGFRFTLEIFRDQVQNGSRSNLLGALFPTTITVSSLETLCCPGGPFEWLSFEILNPESSGWNLNSVNFTGANPGSSPGFCADPVYVDPANNSFRPPQFVSEFPTGSDSVYAITLTTGGYSEFQMTANLVSRFQYGYEFFSWGYQGMSMRFGEGPVLADSTVPELCSGQGGSIYLRPSGLGPYQFSWSNGYSGQNLLAAMPGTYFVSVTDAAGCISQLSQTISPAPPFSFSISESLLPGNQQLLLRPSILGGSGFWTFLWNTGSENDSLMVGENGTYSLQITDTVNGCIYTDSIVVNQFTSVRNPVKNNRIRIHREADGKSLLISGLMLGETMQFLDFQGRKLQVISEIYGTGSGRIQTESFPKGHFLIRIVGQSGSDHVPIFLY